MSFNLNPLQPSPVLTPEQALAYWYSRVNYEQRSPRPGDLKLDRMHALLRLLGDPQDRLRIIHVAGSKGKGSTAAMLASILQQAGYRTGLFTSPHLEHVHERFQVDGRPISNDELASLVATLRRMIEALDRSPENGQERQPVTFFELATALGFQHFRNRRVDAAVIEVGLGGRFDSTNVCNPVVSLITSISLDHTQQLGDRIASIAQEKAGIIKPGRPVVSGALEPDARAVIAGVCAVKSSPLRQLGADFQFSYEPATLLRDGAGDPVHRPAHASVRTKSGAWDRLRLGLIGEHQAANAAVAVACVEELRNQGWHISDAAVRQGLSQVAWPARMEVFPGNPMVILDCAHNIASARAVVDTIQSSFTVPVDGSVRRLVFACSNDKDIRAILGELAGTFDHAYFTRYLLNPRAADPTRLADIWRELSNTPITLATSPAAALTSAVSDSEPDDLVCVTGSVFFAGEVRPLLMNRLSPR